MKICIIMSTYNGEKYLEKQLESIFRDDKKNQIILYVRDDGSSDRTVEIIKEYKKNNNVEIQIVKGENVGSAKSFLLALRNCPKCDFYAFCDQDDEWIEGKLTTAVNDITVTNQPILWCSNYHVTDNDLKIILPSVLHQPVQDSLRVIFYNNVPGCTMVFNWALMQDLRKVNIDEIRMHDIMTINIALITGKVIFNNESFVLYRQHENNVLGYGHKKINLKKWISEKVNIVVHKENYSTAKYAEAVLNAFNSKMNDKQKSEYELISTMNDNFFNRLKVLNRQYTKADFGRTSLSIRIKILLNLM